MSSLHPFISQNESQVGSHRVVALGGDRYRVLQHGRHFARPERDFVLSISVVLHNKRTNDVRRLVLTKRKKWLPPDDAAMRAVVKTRTTSACCSLHPT